MMASGADGNKAELRQYVEDLEQYIEDLEAELVDANSIAAGYAARSRKLAEMEAQLAAGTAELRRYVKGNGFEWCEQESTVFNVTTAIGWLSGALQEAQRKLAEMETHTCDTCRYQSQQATCNCIEDLKLWAGASNFTCSVWR